MTEAVHITAFELENVKRVRAVSLDCSGQALTTIGGRNGQGKTSVLDGIMWALGGDRFRPSAPVHAGEDKAYVRVELDNGITVERKGVNGALKVTSPNGRGGQALLNEFVNQFALDLPKFCQATGAEKAQMLLAAYPDLGPKLQRLNEEAKRIYDERLDLGRVADQKAKYAEELPFNPDVPEKPLSGAEMARRLQDVMSVNARNQSVRQHVGEQRESVRAQELVVRSIEKRVEDLRAALAEAELDLSTRTRQLDLVKAQLVAAEASVNSLQDQDTSSIHAELEKVDSINAKVRDNENKRMAEEEALRLREQYDDLTTALEKVRAERLALLAGIKMPLDGLSIDEAGVLVFRGQQWDCMSGSEQLRVATAICAAMKPACGFVLLDKLECMDTTTLREFASWLAERKLQAIGTRVGTGDECSLVLEDGVGVETAKYQF